jgi:TonB family protein
MASSPLASIPAEGSTTHRPIELARQQGAGSQPIELRHAELKLSRPAMTMAKNPEPSVTPASEKKTDYVARRTLAGASLVGPVVDRPLVSYETPTYPEWAKREAVEASVTLYFVVLPDGRVKENILIQKTSAFEDFDRNATSALLTWRFEPLQGEATGEQWGLITFHYKLSDA